MVLIRKVFVVSFCFMVCFAGVGFAANRMKTCKKEAVEWLDANKRMFEDSAMAIHGFAELALEEYKSSEYLAGMPKEALPPFIFAGSAGLSAAMLHLDQKQAEKKGHPILTVVGSVNPKNYIQIERLVETRNTHELYVPWQFLLEYNENSSKRLLSEAIELLSNGNDLALRTSRSSDDMESAKSEGKKIGLSSAKVADAISDGLQRFVMGILEKVNIGGLMVTGGTTALKLLQETGCEGIEVFREIEPGVPLGEIVGGKLNGLKIVTKAGGFGSSDVFRLGLDVVKQEE